MAELFAKSSAPVSLQGHAGVVAKVGLGDRRVAGVARQLDGDGRRGPVSLAHVLDVSSFVESLIVIPQSVRPHDAARGKAEARRRIGDPAPAPLDHDAERHGIVARSRIDRVSRGRCSMAERDPRAVGVVYARCVHAIPGVFFVDAVTVGFPDIDTAPQIDAVDDDAHRR